MNYSSRAQHQTLTDKRIYSSRRAGGFIGSSGPANYSTLSREEIAPCSCIVAVPVLLCEYQGVLLFLPMSTELRRRERWRSWSALNALLRSTSHKPQDAPHVSSGCRSKDQQSWWNSQARTDADSEQTRHRRRAAAKATNNTHRHGSHTMSTQVREGEERRVRAP